MFRKAPPEAVDLISRLLEYTPTQRLSAVQAMIHPFFDDLRDPNTRLPDSRHPNGPIRDLPNLFDFSRHGRSYRSWDVNVTLSLTSALSAELSIAPELNHRLVPPHARAALAARGLDIDNLKPMTKEEMMARLD